MDAYDDILNRDILGNRYDMISLLCEEEKEKLTNYIKYAFSLGFNVNRDPTYDKEAMIDCCHEILLHSVDSYKRVIDMSSKIQKSLSNQEVRDGWRVSYSVVNNSERYYYLNDLLKERRVISFRCRLE